MIKPLLEQLRATVENAQGLKETTKSELLKLVTDLENQTDNPHGIIRLTTLVEELEISHPEITDVANRVATMLGNVGI